MLSEQNRAEGGVDGQLMENGAYLQRRWENRTSLENW